MSYNTALADNVRAFLAEVPGIDVTEKEMFAVLNFMVNGKTCVCVSGDNLMLRFDPALQELLSERTGYETMLMKGKVYRGYCYITPEGFKQRSDFEYYLRICLEYNTTARKSNRKKRTSR